MKFNLDEYSEDYVSNTCWDRLRDSYKCQDVPEPSFELPVQDPAAVDPWYRDCAGIIRVLDCSIAKDLISRRREDRRRTKLNGVHLIWHLTLSFGGKLKHTMLISLSDQDATRKI